MKRLKLSLLIAVFFSQLTYSQILTSISGLVVHIPFTNVNNIPVSVVNPIIINANRDAINASAIPTIAGGWFRNAFSSYSTIAINSFAPSASNFNALSLTGSDFITANVTVPSSGFTVAFWINLAGISGNRNIITFKDGTIDRYRINFNTTASIRYRYLGLYMNGNGTITGNVAYEYDNAFTATDVPQRWVHYVFTWNNSTKALAMYEDGKLKATNTVNASIVLSNTTLMGIGGGVTGEAGNNRYSGLIDEISIFNRALSGTEVSLLYSRCQPITEVSRTQPPNTPTFSSIQACALTTYGYTISVSGALSGYWRRQDVLGTTGTLTFSGLSYNAVPLTTVGHTLNIKYIASNECALNQEFTFNTIQTSAANVPSPFLQPYTLANNSTVIGCTQSGYRIHLLGENTSNSTYSLWKFNTNSNSYSPTNLTPSNNQFIIASLQSSEPNKTLNMGTYLGVATNVCGTATTAGLAIKDAPLSFTGDFLRINPTTNQVWNEADNGLITQSVLYRTTLPAINLGSTAIFDAGIITTTSNNTRSWLRNGQSFLPFNSNPWVLTITNFSPNSIGTYRLTTANTCANIAYDFEFVLSSVNNNPTAVINGNYTISNIYPNPTETGEITFSLPAGTLLPLTLELYDGHGKCIHTFTLNHPVQSIFLGHLPKGIYYLKNGQKSYSILYK